MKIYSATIRILVVTLALLTMSGNLSAQKKGGAGKGQVKTSAKAPKREKINVKVTVTDEQGNPLPGTQIFSSRLRYVYTTGADGSVSAMFEDGETIKINAEGHESRVLSLSEAQRGPVQLVAVPVFTDEKSRIETTFGHTDKRRTVGAYSIVQGSDMEANPTMYLMNALGGRLNGLFSMDMSSEPGRVTSSDYVRNGMSGYTIMVDGVERSMRALEPEAIESVTLLKDASLKSLYGGVNTNGILMIRTKKGRPYENQVRVNVQSGVQMPTRLPQYLDAYDYAKAFNKVVGSDYFDAEQWRKSDRDPILYPDVDYYGQFLKKSMSLTRVNGQISGGNDKTRYFAHMGYQRNGGLERYTSYPTTDEVVNVRGNVENTIKNFITLISGFSGGIETTRNPFGVETGNNARPFSTQFFNALSDNRPNEFPILISGRRVGQPHLAEVLGGTTSNSNNPYGMLTRTGYQQVDNTFIEAKFTVDIDLNRWVTGLVIRPSISFDFYSSFNARTGGTYAVYERMSDDTETFASRGTDSKITSFSRYGEQHAERNQVFSTVIEYNRTWGDHSLNALGVVYQQQRVFVRSLDQIKRFNVGAMANYMYKNRYVIEASLNRVGLGSFSPKERFRYLPTVGLGWVVSDEKFMQNASWLDFLKVRGSYGILGSTNYIENGMLVANLYRDRWVYNGTYSGTGGGYIDRAYPSITGNPDLAFQLSHEINAGIEFLAFKGALWGTFGWYRNNITGLFSNMANLTPGVLGGGAALPTVNYGTRVASGWEGEMSYTFKKGDWKFLVGGNFTYGKVDITKLAEPDYPNGYEGLLSAKQVGDIRGWKVIGTFADQADIDASPKQQFGQVLPGDLKYADTNNDGYINDKDRVVIGNEFPSWQYGISISIEWKGINLDLMGYGLAGFQQNLSGNKYYQAYGSHKYSNAVRDGLPNGNPLPAIRVENSANNYKNSDWWIVNGGYFKLRNVELGYTLPQRVTSKIGINSLKVFARGFNLLTISKIKDLDPEYMRAGLTGYPLATTITGGVSLTF